MGIGGAYKWMSLRVSFALTKNLRNVENYGKTSYFGLGFDFPLKKMHFEFDLSTYSGYALKNAYLWDQDLKPGQKNEIHPDATTLSISVNSYYFQNKDFKINYLRGKTGHYNKQVHTWYLKGTVNLQGLSNTESIIPLQLADSLNSKTFTSTVSAFDFGVIPGYAYVNRIRNWQFAGIIGFGPVIQSKFYIVNGSTRGYLGLAPRYDIRFLGGYNTRRWFVMLSAEFDNKTVNFQDFKYRNHSYTARIVGGIRLNPIKKKSKIK